MKYTFILVKKAKGSGGDKYCCKDTSDWIVYFPQVISRRSDIDEPKLSIEIEIDDR
jgi:hypothetical protein